jgi:hypothetical protein
MRIGLFVPCHIDAMFPQVGVATHGAMTGIVSH